MAAKQFDPLPRSIRDPVSLALAGVIRDWRLRRGWSLSHLAGRSRLSRQMLSFIESNRRLATTETLERIARALHFVGSELLQAAEQRASRWPGFCRACNYSCVAYGRLRWLNRRHVCVRPAR